jgi:hypothetical protein
MMRGPSIREILAVCTFWPLLTCTACPVLGQPDHPLGSFEIRDPQWDPAFGSTPEIHGTMGTTFEKELMINHHGQEPISNLSLEVGLSKYEDYPPDRGDEWFYFGTIPQDWDLEPRNIEIGSLSPDGNSTFTIRGRIRRVGRYYLLLRARWQTENQNFTADLTYNRVVLHLQPRGGESSADPIFYLSLVFLGIVLANYIARRRAP